MHTLPFIIDVDRAKGLISAKAYQFWTLAVLEQFEARVRAEQDAIRRSGLRPLFLIDVREHGVQSREVVEGLQKFADSEHCRPTKTAIIVESALYRLQAARIGAAPHHATFRDEHDALEWLLQDEASSGFEGSVSGRGRQVGSRMA